MKVKSYIASGNSFPIIIENQGVDILVKLKAGMSGKYSLITEYIGNRLGELLELPTLTPRWIELDKELIRKNLYIEVNELIDKSLGLNIAFEYLQSARDVKKEKLHEYPSEVKNEIFLFDLMMINVDRTSDNLNLLHKNNLLISIDYESSQLIQEIFGSVKLLQNKRILQGFRNNPLYHEVEENNIHNFLSKAKKISIEKILNEIPEQLLNERGKAKIIQGFQEKQKRDWEIIEALSQMKGLTPTTFEEEKKKRNKNQAEFIRKFKENLK